MNLSDNAARRFMDEGKGLDIYVIRVRFESETQILELLEGYLGRKRASSL